jgi:CHAT domain-containing protein
MYADERLRSGTAISADSPALVVASTAASQADGLFPLPDVIAEGETVASEFQHSRLLDGENANLNMVKGGLRTAAVFHFAGHSLSTPEGTGLMLEDKDPQTGRPRLLGADLLRRLRSPNLQLAVLSACGTGKTGAADSSGFANIAETLLRAGVPHVVASRWGVDSVQTHGFIEDFYRGLLSGIPLSEATRVSARKMLAHPQTEHPYYWSAFAAYGRP